MNRRPLSLVEGFTTAARNKIVSQAGERKEVADRPETDVLLVVLKATCFHSLFSCRVVAV